MVKNIRMAKICCNLTEVKCDTIVGLAYVHWVLVVNIVPAGLKGLLSTKEYRLKGIAKNLCIKCEEWAK